MQFSARSGNPEKARTHCIVTGVYSDNELSDIAKLLDKASNRSLSKILKRGDMNGKVGQTLLLHDVAGVMANRVLVVGLGKRESLDSAKFKLIVQSAINKLKDTNSSDALLCLSEVQVKDKDIHWQARKIVELTDHTIYQFTEMKSKKPPAQSLKAVTIFILDKKSREVVNAAIDIGVAVSAGVTAARNLANLPGNICTPTYMAEESLKLAKKYKSIDTTVIDEEEMKKLGMGALLSVSAGSVQPAKLIVMQYKGAADKVRPYVFVGKGISFDTGGISLKPGAAMGEMIFDMCGAASVYGTMITVAELKLPINVVGVISSAENMPGGNATKPGDIVKSMSGQTIEINNTDAEGRLVLCDALTYVDRYKPETVVDVATLTGAIITALGSHACGLYANDETLAEELLAAGDDSLDRAWRMPIWEDYQSQLASSSADMLNSAGRPAGSVTAACFLARYTKKYRWAHIDIAGTAYIGGSKKGATGSPVSLLTEYLLSKCQ